MTTPSITTANDIVTRMRKHGSVDSGRCADTSLVSAPSYIPLPSVRRRGHSVTACLHGIKGLQRHTHYDNHMGPQLRTSHRMPQKEAQPLPKKVLSKHKVHSDMRPQRTRSGSALPSETSWVSMQYPHMLRKEVTLRIPLPTTRAKHSAPTVLESSMEPTCTRRGLSAPTTSINKE